MSEPIPHKTDGRSPAISAGIASVPRSRVGAIPLALLGLAWLAPCLQTRARAADAGPAEAPAAEPTPADPTLDRANEIATKLEKEIEARALARDERVEAARKGREAINLLNRADAMPAAEKRDTDFLRSAAGSLERSLGAMDQTIAAARREREDAQARVGLVAPLALHAVRNSGPAAPASMVFGVLMDHERRRAQATVERELKIEMMRGDREGRKSDLERETESRGKNMKLTPEQIKRRRDELMSEIQGMGRQAAADATDLESLEDARARVELAVAAVRNSGLPVARERLNGVLDETEKTLAEPAGDAHRASGSAPKKSAKTAQAKNENDDKAAGTGKVAGKAGAGAGTVDDIPYEEQTELSLGARPGGEAAGAEIRIGTLAEAPNREVFWPKKAAPAHALASGAVIFSGAFAEYRHILIVDHGGGWASVYGNLSFCDLVEGNNVTADQKLGEFTPADEGEEPIPFWVEARLQGRPQPLGHWPAAGAGWRERLMGGASGASDRAATKAERGADSDANTSATPIASQTPAASANATPTATPTPAEKPTEKPAEKPTAKPKRRGKKS